MKLAECQDKRSRCIDDAATLRATAYLRAQANARPLQSADSVLIAARELYDANGSSRWRLEATILTGMPPTAVAKKLSLDPALVIVYEEMFFDVRPRLKAMDWVALHAYGTGPGVGFAVDDLASLWRWVGYCHGETLLDLVCAATAGINAAAYSAEKLESAELFVLMSQIGHGQDSKRWLQLRLRAEADLNRAHPSLYHLPRRTESKSQTTPPAAQDRAKRSPCLLGRPPQASHNNLPAGWEKRQRGGLYYYRPARINGKPRRIYLGHGLIGRIHELLDRRERRAKAAARVARQQREASLAELDRRWSEAWGWVRTLASAYLVMAGWYNHHGEWRKVMGKPRTRKLKPRPATPAEAAGLRARLDDLNARASADDATARAELRVFLDEHPEVWQTVGDLNRLSVDGWLSQIAGKDQLYRESLQRSLAKWKADLMGDDDSPTVMTLVDSAAVARLALMYAEAQAASSGGSAKAVAFNIKRLESAQRHLNAIMKLLVQLRSAYPQSLLPRSSPAVGNPRLYVPSRDRKKKAG